MKNQKLLLSCAVSLFAAVALSGCMGKPDLEELVEIKPNETAFMIRLEGDTQKGQAKFMSEEFLNENLVATKRVQIPHRKRVTGNGSNDYEWIPTVKLITVDRTPVSLDWNPKTQSAIKVESLESIDFTIGVVMTASIPQDKAAKFLYHYAGKSLKDVANQDIQTFVKGILSREFGVRKLEIGQKEKQIIFDIALKEAKEHFAQFGVDINNLGYSEGMTYTDPEVQGAINKTFAAQMAVETAKAKVNEAVQVRMAAEEFAKARDAQVAKVSLDIEMLKAQAMVEFAKNVKPGMLPNVVPQGSQLMFGLDKPLK